jgi:hypothetical protein
MHAIVACTAWLPWSWMAGVVSILPHDKVRIYNHACDRHMNGLTPMKLDGVVFSILPHDKVRIYNHACDRHMNGLTPHEVGCGGCLASCLMTKWGYTTMHVIVTWMAWPQWSWMWVFSILPHDKGRIWGYLPSSYISTLCKSNAHFYLKLKLRSNQSNLAVEQCNSTQCVPLTSGQCLFRGGI